MATLIIRLDPRLLDYPDADIRYQLPDLLAERSEGVISDDGFDYVSDGPLLLLVLKSRKAKSKHSLAWRLSSPRRRLGRENTIWSNKLPLAWRPE